MASRVIDNRVEITCDTCGTEAPPAEEIMRAHGLNRLGWYCVGGKHICPIHKPHPGELDESSGIWSCG